MRPRTNPPKDPADPVSVNTAIVRCLMAAEDTIATISEFWESREKDAITGWYVLNFIIPAVLVAVMCLRYDSVLPQAASWKDQVRRAMSVIESMASLNNSASHCLDITKSLLNDCHILDNQHASLIRDFTHIQFRSRLLIISLQQLIYCEFTTRFIIRCVLEKGLLIIDAYIKIAQTFHSGSSSMLLLSAGKRTCID